MLPASTHELQGPAQAVLQQAPCAQCPLAQSASAVQAATGLWPQLPLLHAAPFEQSSFFEQVALHAVPLALQRYGAQEKVEPPAQRPVPSQTIAVAYVEPVQDVGRQSVPAA
jgi:hypothetical protein